METLDGKEKKRIANTLDTKEIWAFFTEDGNYIFYGTTDDNFLTDRYFIQSIKNEDDQKKEISEEDPKNWTGDLGP